ncbi:MAG: 3-carboxy-cis,cis-muconate cycloisomerase, partial [Pseudomonadota bacterium]
MSYTPYNAPLLSGLLGDMEVAAFFSVKADIEAMVRFEVALARAEADAGVIPEAAAVKIKAACDAFEPDMRALSTTASRDGLVIPDLVRQLREAVGADHAEHVHKGTTSQDLIDTSLVLRLKDANTVLSKRLNGVIDLLEALTTSFGDNRLMAHTRLQAAKPISVSDRLSNWIAPVESSRNDCKALFQKLYQVQFGGPVGTLSELSGKGADVRAGLARALDLHDPGRCWHTDRSAIVSYTDWLSRLTGTLGKIGQDFALMAQSERSDLAFDGGGYSSAMAHKANPVKAESLVTLARFNATLSPA